MAVMTEKPDGKEKDNKGKVNFTWKEVDSNVKRKGRRRLFGLKKGRDKGTTRRHKWLRAVAVILCIFLIAAALAVRYVWNSVPEINPDARSIYSNIDLSSLIYDSKGKEIDKLYYTEDREIVSINDIPENTKNAFIAIEDKTFYSHHGLNYKDCSALFSAS